MSNNNKKNIILYKYLYTPIQLCQILHNAKLLFNIFNRYIILRTKAEIGENSVMHGKN